MNWPCLGSTIRAQWLAVGLRDMGFRISRSDTAQLYRILTRTHCTRLCVSRGWCEEGLQSHSPLMMSAETKYSYAVAGLPSNVRSTKLEEAVLRRKLMYYTIEQYETYL
ncbi:hypothetical protein Q1695_015095 [Nippostrongylus brasiliensis]|nr:hypothetical protein Q1695_015095 [Nippostrongylus brasiliensis]